MKAPIRALFITLFVCEPFLAPRILMAPRQVDTIRLELVLSFPSEGQAGPDTFLYGATYFDQNRKGDIYVSNTKEGNVLCFDPTGRLLAKFGRKGKGPGELSYITNIIAEDDFILVNDLGNRKFQLFDTAGQPRNALKVYSTYNRIVFDKNTSLIFAARMINSPDEKLIDAISLKGDLVRSFGAPMKFDKKLTLLNDVNLAFGPQGNLLVAFSMFPIIRVYSKEGTLLRELHIDWEAMRSKERENLARYKASLHNTSNPYFFRVINAIRTLDNRVYLLSLPTKSVLELNADLSINRGFFDVQSSDPDYFANDFIPNQTTSGMIFYVLQSLPDNIVDVFGQK